MKQVSVQESRVKKLRAGLEEVGLRGVVLAPGPNMMYFTGVNSLMLERPFMLLVPVRGEPHLVVPKLEAGPYQEAQLDMKIHAWTDSEGPGDAIGKAVRGTGMKGKWGVEGRVPFLYLDRLIKKASPRIKNAEPTLQGLRAIKDETEVKLLRRSAAILSSAFEDFPGLVKEGLSEVELAKAATDVIYTKGATKVDDMLVQSGPMAADPHHLPSVRKISHGECVLIDVGSTLDGYYADITRTFCVGSSSEFEKVYGEVLEAQESGIGEASEGVRVGSVDSAARNVLKKAGLGRYFFHRTGHGLGLEIHEAPFIVEGGKERLEPNMCFTVEPGAYLRGKLGVRIEDDVLMEGGRGVVITDTPKEYGWWK